MARKVGVFACNDVLTVIIMRLSLPSFSPHFPQDTHVIL